MTADTALRGGKDVEVSEALEIDLVRALRDAHYRHKVSQELEDGVTDTVMFEAADMIESQAAQIETMEQALRPFSEAWRLARLTGISRAAYLNAICAYEVSHVHFQRARAALRKEGEE